MGARHDRFCDPLATHTAETRRSLGDSGPVHEVGTFSSLSDDLHIGGILPIVYLRDCPATWSASVHSFE